MKQPVKLILSLLCFVALVVAIVFALEAKSRREVAQILADCKPGTPYADVVARLGKPVHDYSAQGLIQRYGTRKENDFTANTIMHMFPHRALPYRWILIYTDVHSEKVIFADSENM